MQIISYDSGRPRLVALRRINEILVSVALIEFPRVVLYGELQDITKISAREIAAFGRCGGFLEVQNLTKTGDLQVRGCKVQAISLQILQCCRFGSTLRLKGLGAIVLHLVAFDRGWLTVCMNTRSSKLCIVATLLDHLLRI
jgi:hypothetical protein